MPPSLSVIIVWVIKSRAPEKVPLKENRIRLSLLHYAPHFNAFGQRHAECVEAGGETTEVDDSLFLEGCHAAACVVIHVNAHHLLISLYRQPAGGGVGIESDVAGLWLQAVAVVVQVSLGSHTERDVVDVVVAVVAGVSGGEGVAECDEMSVARVAAEVDRDRLNTRGAVVDSGDRCEGTWVAEAVHDADLKEVLGVGLPEEEGEPEGADVAVELRHGVDAAVVEQEGVGA